jgi:hypothetical protein
MIFLSRLLKLECLVFENCKYVEVDIWISIATAKDIKMPVQNLEK